MLIRLFTISSLGFSLEFCMLALAALYKSTNAFKNYSVFYHNSHIMGFSINSLRTFFFSYNKSTLKFNDKLSTITSLFQVRIFQSTRYLNQIIWRLQLISEVFKFLTKKDISYVDNYLFLKQ